MMMTATTITKKREKKLIRLNQRNVNVFNQMMIL